MCGVEFGFPRGENCFLVEKIVSSWRRCRSWRSLFPHGENISLFPHGGACNYQASSRKACGQPLIRASPLEVLGRIRFPSGEVCFLMEKMQVVEKFVSSWSKCKPVSSWRSL